MYCVLCLVYTTRLAFTQGDLGLVGVLRSSRGWKYLLIGVIDVEANYFVVKAYGYTSVTSVQVRTGLSGKLPFGCKKIGNFLTFNGNFQECKVRTI